MHEGTATTSTAWVSIARPRPRWSRHTRNWMPVGAVTLNPERDRVVHNAVLQAQHNRAAAA